MTVPEPFVMTSGGPTQVHMSLERAAGTHAIRQVTPPGGKTGPPTCGTGPLNIGQVCISPTRAAGCPISVSFQPSLSSQIGFANGLVGFRCFRFDLPRAAAGNIQPARQQKLALQRNLFGNFR